MWIIIGLLQKLLRKWRTKPSLDLKSQIQNQSQNLKSQIQNQSQHDDGANIPLQNSHSKASETLSQHNGRI